MARLLNLNQVPATVWNGYMHQLGPAAAANLLRADISSALVNSQANQLRRMQFGLKLYW